MKKPEPLAVGFSGEIELPELERDFSFLGTKAAENCYASAISSEVISLANESRKPAAPTKFFVAAKLNHL